MANRNFAAPFYGADQELAFPGPLAVGASGKGVRRVQEWLTYHGQRPTIDGDFGPATERYVRVFQSANSLRADGIVDETTWTKLTAPLYRAMRPISGTNKTLNDLVVAYARQHLAESPVEIGGPNDGPWVRAYMLGNGGKIWQWCSGFCMALLAQAVRAKGGTELPFVPSFGVPQVARSAKGRGRFLADGPAVPGDLFVIPTVKGSWSHIGVVLEWNGPAAKFISAEGNTNAEGSADGTVARSMPRNPTRCDFLRVGP